MLEYYERLRLPLTAEPGESREGRPLLEMKGELSTKQILRLIFPLYLEQVVLLALPVINAILVSSAGQAALSGVSLVDQINMMLSFIFLYAMSGISIVAAQYFGRGDQKNLKFSVRQAFAASHIVSIVITALMFFFGNVMLELFMYGADANILSEAKNYFRILIFSFPFYSFYSICVAALRGVGNTRKSMVVSITQNVCTVAFSSVLIYVLHLGVYGAAIGMIGGRIVGSVLGAAFLWRSRVIDGFRDMFSFRIDFPMQKKIFKFGIPQSIENCLFMLARVIISTFVLRSGIDQVAASSAVYPISDLQTFGAGSFVIFVTTLVAYAKGTDDNVLARKYLGKVYLLTSIVILVSTLGSIPLLPGLLSLYHLSDTAFAAAVKILTFQGIAQGVFYAAAFMLPAGFKGAGDVVAPSLASMLIIWLIRMPVCYLFAVVLGWGALGLWVGVWIDFAARSTYNLYRWRSWKWLGYHPV